LARRIAGWGSVQSDLAREMVTYCSLLQGQPIPAPHFSTQHLVFLEAGTFSTCDRYLHIAYLLVAPEPLQEQLGRGIVSFDCFIVSEVTAPKLTN
jgi:hypothetical protein